MTLPRGSRPNAWLWLGLAVVVLLAVLPPVLAGDPAVLNILVITLMYVALASAWNLGCGYSGYISLGHAAFFGFGAYALGLLLDQLGPAATEIGGPYGPFILAPLIGLLTAAVAIPFGWIAFRTRLTAFVIVTIALMFVVQSLALNLRDVTGGSQGLGFPVGPWGTSYGVPFYYVMLGIAAFTVLLSWVIRRSNFGLGLLAIRDDEDRAQAAGVPTGSYKLIAFVVSAGLFGTIGGIYGYYLTYIYPQFAVDPLLAASVVLMSFLGGVGTVLGPILGAVIVEPSQLLLSYYVNEALYLILYGALFLVVVLLLPRGIIPSLAERLEAWRAARRIQGPAVEAAPGAPPAPGAKL
jgi:ABC-type branched-chain amino acid transport system, permease component